MCNCNRPKPNANRPRPMSSGVSGGSKQTFSLILKDGTTTSFGSRLEADAANVRSGYQGIVKPKGT